MPSPSDMYIKTQACAGLFTLYLYCCDGHSVGPAFPKCTLDTIFDISFVYCSFWCSVAALLEIRTPVFRYPHSMSFILPCEAPKVFLKCLSRIHSASPCNPTDRALMLGQMLLTSATHIGAIPHSTDNNCCATHAGLMSLWAVSQIG